VLKISGLESDRGEEIGEEKAKKYKLGFRRGSAAAPAG